MAVDNGRFGDLIVLLSRFLLRGLFPLSLSVAFAAPTQFTPLPRFDAAAQTAVQARLTQAFDAPMAARLALLQHPEARKALLDIGSTPNAVLAAGWLQEGELDLWQALIGSPAKLDNLTSQTVQTLQQRSQAAQAAWYRAAAAVALQPLLVDQQTSAEALAELARSRRQAGNLSRFDEATTLAEAGQARLAALQENQEASQALLALRREMGLAPDTLLQLAPLPTPPLGIPRFSGLLDLARQQNLLARHALDAIRQDRSASEQNMLRQTTLSLPLFSGKNALGHKENQIGTRLTAESTMHELASQITLQESALVLAQQQWQHLAQEVFPQRQAANAEAFKHYNGMLRGVDELLKSRTAELETHRQLIAAQRDYWLAWLALESLVGGKLPTPRYDQPPTIPAPSPIETAPLHH